MSIKVKYGLDILFFIDHLAALKTPGRLFRPQCWMIMLASSHSAAIMYFADINLLIPSNQKIILCSWLGWSLLVITTYGQTAMISLADNLIMR